MIFSGETEIKRERLKMIQLKTARQLDGIRTSCKLLIETFHVVEPLIQVGVSTQEVDAKVHDFITTHGGRPSFLGYNGFPASICASVNETVIHGIPDDKPLREGDIVGIDIGIDLDGYFSDSAVTYTVGSVDTHIRDLMTATKESLFLGIEQARAGNRIKDISVAVYQHTKNKGYGVVRPYCGHGVGLAIHEDPQVPNYVGRGPNPRLKPGMVLAIEPMINLGGDDVYVLDDDWTVVTADHSISAHFEHTVAILEDQTEILTLAPS